MNIGARYNWKHQPERLVYLGHNWSGNGYWHQFAKVESPDVIWCEVLTGDLHMIEETKAEPECGHPACKSLGEPHPFCEFVKAQDRKEASTDE